MRKLDPGIIRSFETLQFLQDIGADGVSARTANDPNNLTFNPFPEADYVGLKRS
jgi:hypothetical protein